jgi:hypothetical protein
MLCNYLVDIYKNHIHKSLADDEYKYSKYIDEQLNDLWIGLKPVMLPKHKKSLFYVKDDVIWFELDDAFKKIKCIYYFEDMTQELLNINHIQHDFIMCYFKEKIKNVHWVLGYYPKYFQERQEIYDKHIKRK